MGIKTYKDNFKFVTSKFKGVAFSLILIGAAIVAGVLVIAEELP